MIDLFRFGSGVQNIGGVLSTPPVRNLAKKYGIDINEVHGSGDDGRVSKEYVPPVRNLAKKYGIDINEVHGSGDDGRVSKEYVIRSALQKRIKEDSSVSEDLVLEKISPRSN
ncbi:hypothetical protein ACLB2K_045069 [Fragaria x ananassa]